MSRVITVAIREFRQTVFRKVFLLAIIGMPLLIVGIMVLAVLIIVQHKEPPLVGTVMVVSNETVAAAARTEFEPKQIQRDESRRMREQSQMIERAARGGQPPMNAASPGSVPMPLGRGLVEITIESVAPQAADLAALRERVRNDELLALAVIEDDVLDWKRRDETPQASDEPQPDDDGGEGEDASESDRSGIILYVHEGLDSDHVDLIERRLEQSVVRVRAETAGLDPEEAFAMLRAPSTRTIRTLVSGEDASESETVREMKQMIPMVFMMLIWIGVMVSAQHLLMTTIEEKSNKVMEVLLSAVSPFQLMTGKILGHGAVGLLIVTFYSSLGMAALIAVSFAHLIDPMSLVYLGVYFVMAYFMIASLMAAVGSAVSDIREANTLVTPVMMLLIIPLMLWMPIIQDPNGGIAVAFSFIPPAIPFAMILRLAAEESVPAWQIPASIAWGFACTVGMIWMAAKIFRVGVLMTGKPPSPLELLKWLRYS